MGILFSKRSENKTSQTQPKTKTRLSTQRCAILNQRKLLHDMERMLLLGDNSYSQEAIEMDRQKLDSLETAEKTRDLLHNTVNKFDDDLKTMIKTRDFLNEIENQPGELITFCRAFNDVCKEGEETQAVLNAFNLQANLLFDLSFDLQLRTVSTVSSTDTRDVLAVGSDDFIFNLNKLKDLNIKAQLCCGRLEEKAKHLDLDSLKNNLMKKEMQLKKEWLKLIGKGSLAFLAAISIVGIIVVAGVCLFRYAPQAANLSRSSEIHVSMKDIGSTLKRWATANVPKYFSELFSMKKELKSIEACQQTLSGLNTLQLETIEEVIMVLETTITEAQNCREQLKRRLTEHQELINSRQEKLQAELLAKEEHTMRIKTEEENLMLRQQLESMRRQLEGNGNGNGMEMEVRRKTADEELKAKETDMKRIKMEEENRRLRQQLESMSRQLRINDNKGEADGNGNGCEDNRSMSERNIETA